MTKVIGLTGGIGTGKSAVAQIMEGLGAAVIDADSLAHEALIPGTDTWRDVVAAFGNGIVSPEGGIDRPALAKIVFNNPELLARLNQIVHPRLKEVAKDKIGEYQAYGSAVIVLEAPLLIEAGWDDMVDEVWVVTAAESRIMERLVQRGLQREDILARMRTQLSTGERLKHADIVINNDGSLDELRGRVAGLMARLLSDVQRG